MKISHNFFLDLAFNLAEKNLGKTYKNPSVGCVIVKNNSVISSGVTSINGRPHAEFNALNNDLDFRESFMYVTLEPCTHYGVTAPCTQIIKKKKIKKVFYLFDDPDKRTYRKASKNLKSIKKLNIFKSKYKDFYKSYFTNKKKNFPLIDAKLAISKDFFSINNHSKWITNSRSRKVAHLIRSKYDCVVSTSLSINKDNSLLNCRIKGLNNCKPDLAIIDRNLDIKKNLKLFEISKKRKTYIFTISNNAKKISFLKKKKIKIIKLKKLNDKNDLRKVFETLYELGKGRVLVESGLVFLRELFKFNLINDLYLFKSDYLLKRKGSNNTSVNFIKKLKINKMVNVNLKNDSLYKIKVRNV